MNNVKKLIGLLSIVIGIVAEYLLISAIANGTLIKNAEENKIFAMTVIPVSLPIIVGGLTLFGFYALKGEYNDVKMD